MLKETGVHHLSLLCTLGRLAWVMFLPLWLFYDLGHILSSSLWYSEQGDQLTVNVLFLLIVDGVLHWLQNILAFTLLKLVAPLTYAVANVTKRVAIISVSLLLLQNQVQILKLLLDHKIVCVVYYKIVYFRKWCKMKFYICFLKLLR